jgi:hypothetical protein
MAKQIRRLRVVGVLIALMLGGMTLQAEGWVKVGSEKVNRKSETDSVSVGKRKNLRYIRLHVSDAGVIIERWVLEYRDGTKQHVGFVGLLAAETTTPPVQLMGRLKKIHFKYYSAPGPKKARIEVQGIE